MFPKPTRLKRNPKDATVTAKIYVVANQKGGVGKTTTAVNTASAMAIGGWRTLVIDLDPQGNATSHLGLNRRLERNIYRVLIDDIPVEEACHPTPVDNLWVVPAHPDLYGASLELPDLEDWPFRLAAVISPLRYTYRFIWIDTPPSLGVLTLNALTAGDALIVPVQCEYLALEGLSILLEAVERVRRTTNPRLSLEAVILTMYDERTNLARQVRDEIERFFAGRADRFIIPRNVRLAEAPSFGEPIFTYDFRSRGATAYLQLTKELLAHGS